MRFNANGTLINSAVFSGPINSVSPADVGSNEEWAIHPPVMAVERRFDQATPHHTVIYLG